MISCMSWCERTHTHGIKQLPFGALGHGALGDGALGDGALEDVHAGISACLLFYDTDSFQRSCLAGKVSAQRSVTMLSYMQMS